MSPILLLHGAIGAADQLMPLAGYLGAECQVYAMNFPGHGGKDEAGDFSIDGFSREVLQFLEDEQIDKVTIMGYSMGGYVAMYLARHWPDKVDRIVTLGTKYKWDAEIAAKEVQMLDPEKITLKLPEYAGTLQKRHSPNDWKQLLHKTARMLTTMGNNSPLNKEDYEQIAHRTLLLLGDRDKMVALEETADVYRWLTHAQLCVLPGTPHPIEQVDASLLSYIVLDFLNKCER